ncbi:MAG: M50 family metallopeptidase [Acidimicrobiales bacterium]|nr:M50 family metallopeptidase [Acidimicrobiales bacterium]
MSAGMVAWVVMAIAVVLWKPGEVVAWTPLLAVISVVVSTLVHEGAHAWAAHNLGYRVEWVVLGGLVGMTAYFGRDDRPLERAAVALAGPAASAALVLALIGARVSMSPASTATVVVELALLLNVVGLVGNLLPVGGTDGAHLLRGLFEHRRRSTLQGDR